MTATVAVRPRVAPRFAPGLPAIYAAALLGWLLTRLLVLVHQGAWPWMNAFVVAAARGIVVGDWNEAVRPQLPAVLGVPLVLAGLSEQQTVAVLYVVASLVQFAALVVLLRALFPLHVEAQVLGLLLFLLLPFNHSIHHYRDVPVVLASSAVFFLSASFLRVARPRGMLPLVSPTAGGTPPVPPGGSGAFTALTARDVAAVVGAMLLGVWSRTEVLTFVATLCVLALAVWRGAALRVVATFALAAVAVSATLFVVYRVEGVDMAEASLYTAHTFLDSTPDAWLTADCRANPTENCRERDGLAYFGPADLHAGVLPLVLNHPLAALAKTARSAVDNLWILLGPNLSTFPGALPFLLVVAALAAPARATLAILPSGAWVVMAAVLGESVLPPLSWAPPHPQYHLQLVLPIVAVGVPLLLGLARAPRGRVLAVAFLAINAALSAFRYTRYPGY